MESRRHAVSVFQTQSSLRFQAGVNRMTSDSRSFCCDWCSAMTGLLKAAAFFIYKCTSEAHFQAGWYLTQVLHGTQQLWWTSKADVWLCQKTVMKR